MTFEVWLHSSTSVRERGRVGDYLGVSSPNIPTWAWYFLDIPDPMDILDRGFFNSFYVLYRETMESLEILRGRCPRSTFDLVAKRGKFL